MLRIIAGRFRSRRIAAPPSRSVRPTADRVKESLFQILGAAVEGASVLDLYAGSGNLGLESLSRGAARCWFVERAAAGVALIRRNIETLGVRGQTRVFRLVVARALGLLEADGERFDLVLADPPYAKGGERRSEVKKLLRLLDACAIFSPDARVAVEHFAGDRPPEDLKRLKLLTRRRYGDTELSIYEAL